MNTRIFLGDASIDAIPAGNRGMAYGDGLFETLRVHRGDIPWWSSHWARLAGGAARLGIPLPRPAQVRDVAASLFADAGDGVLKLLLSRGGGGRGYAPVADAPPLWILSRHPLPDCTTRSLQLHWCDTRMAIQPLLAGIKHCNRLEQVLARAECARARADEGLMRDGEGSVVSATAANIFVLRQGRWLTPRVDRCGVAGVCRSHLLALLGAGEERLSPAQVEDADAVFLCNAVRGILPVTGLGARTWTDFSPSATAARLLAQSHPGLVADLEQP
jgi:4-amino-4-deoxychorismate lyase